MGERMDVMEDYWNEFRTVRGKGRFDSHSEDDSRSHDDECEDLFLDAVLPGGSAGDREINETELANSRLYLTLTERQRAQLIRRAHERNHTLRQRRLKVKTQKPDLWSIFSAPMDNSSTGTRSRSATPDSLDSISPPRTPPDPNPQNWVDSSLSRSRASLDSGHHSLIMSPSSSLSPISPPSSSPQHLESHLEGGTRAPRQEPSGGKRHLGRRFSPPHPDPRYFYPPEDSEDGHRIYRPSSLDLLSEPPHVEGIHPSVSPSARARKEATVRRQRSYARDVAPRDRPHYAHYGARGHYQLSSKLDADAVEVRGLHYKPIGSLHGARTKPAKESRNEDPDQIPPSQGVHVGIRRSQSIKLHPRDPFEPLGERENAPVLGSTPLVNYEVDGRWENVSRGKMATDLGFRIISGEKDQEFPDVVLEVGRSGQTKIDWLHESDAGRVRTLCLLELDILFSEYRIAHSWRKRRHKQRKLKEGGETSVFGVPLETLCERDQILSSGAPLSESSVPMVLHKLIAHLEMRGLKDEGILRIPGHRAKTEALKKCLDTHFYRDPAKVDLVLRDASANELAALIKLFLRDLPQPLLTYTLSLAFYKTYRIPNFGERILALTMMAVLLPAVHRDTLKAILDLCAKVVSQERDNKMGLYNVAMIIAPNIFLPGLQPKTKVHLKGDDKDHQLHSEMEYARVTTQLVQALIKYREVLWTIPNRFIAQIRHQYESNLKPTNSKAIHKFLARRTKELIHRPIVNEVDYQNGVLRVSAPQFNRSSHPIKLDWQMTAKDILHRLIEEYSSESNESSHRVSGRREQKTTAILLCPPSPPSSHSTLIRSLSASFISSARPPSVGMTTCLLRGSVRHALDNHALHERGGNITEKRIDSNAFLIAVYQDNPNGEFLVKCHHPGGQINLN